MTFEEALEYLKDETNPFTEETVIAFCDRLAQDPTQQRALCQRLLDALSQERVTSWNRYAVTFERFCHVMQKGWQARAK